MLAREYIGKIAKQSPKFTPLIWERPFIKVQFKNASFLVNILGNLLLKTVKIHDQNKNTC